jgi:beta-N-acetylhexosaminidase
VAIALCAAVLAAFAAAVAGLGCGSAADGRGPTATGGEPSAAKQGSASSLPPGELAGARIVAGYNGGANPPAALRGAIRAGHVAGVVLYAENLPSRADARRLIATLQGIPRPVRDPLLILIDQEGGLVKRIDGYRGYGTTAARVSAVGVAFAEGLQEARVAATAKHFPGLGAALDDTDTEVSRIGLSKARLRAVDEAPYRDYAAAGGEMVLVGAGIYPAFSPQPAAFSRALVSGELRHRLGYRGVVMTDALDTVAVAAFGDPSETALAAVRAGCDLLLFTEPGPAEDARRALVRRLRAGTLGREEFEAAAQRVLGLRDGLGP